MGKNIVVCLDGTGNEIKGRGGSNVLKIVELLDLKDPSKQVVYSDPGVGTFSAPSAWTAMARAMSRLGGLALGHGLRQNLGEAYTFLMNTWKPGDQLYVFGFSRGAYTARRCAGCSTGWVCSARGARTSSRTRCASTPGRRAGTRTWPGPRAGTGWTGLRRR